MENYTKDKVGNWSVEFGSKTVPSCEHCFTVRDLTKHHLVPRSTWRLKGMDEYKNFFKSTMVLCESCHVKLHQVRTNKELALQFNTPAKVLGLLQRYEGSSSHERLNRLRFDEYAEVFEGSNMWN